jgi:Flp pilus assembly protein TadG
MKPDRSSAERGQILILFALSLVAIIGMVGLVLDSGSSFAQKRVEQNAADVAALAAAHDLIANQGSANWDATARSVASQNGYTHGVDGAVVEVTCVNCPGAGPNQTFDATVDGVQVTVNITAPHRNNFAGIFGMTTWDVSTTATSKTGWANTAHGPGPFIVSLDAFTGGDPAYCTGPIDECDLEHPVDDTPTQWSEFTWTDFGYDLGYDDPEETCPPDGEPFELGNVNDSDLQNYLDGSADFSVTLEFGCYIAQHNDGVMNNIVADLQALAPTSFPVPIVDDQGKYVGWASFHMTSADPGGRNGIITGYFETGRIQAQLDVKGAGFGSSTFGSAYVVQLVN